MAGLYDRLTPTHDSRIPHTLIVAIIIAQWARKKNPAVGFTPAQIVTNMDTYLQSKPGPDGAGKAVLTTAEKTDLTNIAAELDAVPGANATETAINELRYLLWFWALMYMVGMGVISEQRWRDELGIA